MESTDFLELFLTEAREHVEGQGALLTRARSGSLSRDEIDDLFRHAHSIKGMAASMGFTPMATLAHAMEDLLQRWRDGSRPPSPGDVGLLMLANDHLALQLDAVAARSDPPGGEGIEKKIRALHASAAADAPKPAAPGGTAAPEAGAASIPRLLVDVCLREGTPLPAARAMVILKRLEEHGRVIAITPPPHVLATGRFGGRIRVTLASRANPEALAEFTRSLPDVTACQVGAAASVEEGRAVPPSGDAGGAASPGRPAQEGKTAPRGEAIGTIRVATERMDHLLDGIGELILDRERLKRALHPEPGSPAEELLEGLGRTVDALKDEVLTMRLLPFSSIAPRLERTVRELSARLGKEVDFALRGTDVSLDRSTLEEMLDPLQHILRNCLDHGLEPSEERRAAGKPPRGRITIELVRRDERVRLAVTDDGRGMDPGALRRVAIERRFLSRETAERLSDDEALMLVTIPGFSTAARTTDISGRGVGMDVVRMRVQKLGGHLVIRSEVGSGTRMEMDLPPTVSVTRAFLCRSGEGLFAVPVTSVRATFQVRRDQLQASQGERVLRRGEEMVTLLSLAGALEGDRAAGFPDTFPALQYQVGRHAYALGVDEILGEAPIVVKPLRHPLELLPQYAGAAVLDDGRIALILDPVNLTRTARRA